MLRARVVVIRIKQCDNPRGFLVFLHRGVKKRAAFYTGAITRAVFDTGLKIRAGVYTGSYVFAGTSLSLCHHWIQKYFDAFRRQIIS